MIEIQIFLLVDSPRKKPANRATHMGLVSVITATSEIGDLVNA